MRSSCVRASAGWLLLAVLGCGESSAPHPVGDIAVEVQTVFNGAPVDADGFEVTVDGVPVTRVASSGQVTLAALPAGARSVRLIDVAAECAVQGENPVIISVEPDTTVSLAFSVRCGNGTGSVRVKVVTAGQPADDDGYTILIADQAVGVQAMGEVVVGNLPAGQTTVQITDIAPNCAVVGPARQDVAVPLGEQIDVQFQLSCIGTMVYDLIFEARTGESSTLPDLYRVNASGLHLTNLTQSVDAERQPSWAHGGTRVAFNRSPDVGPGNLFIMQADGSGSTDIGIAAVQPDWSPDDSQLAVAIDRNIFVLNSDGTGLSQLTGVTCEHFVDSCSRLSAPDWSPDGSRILYYRGGGLFVAKGCEVINVDHSGGNTPLNSSCTNPTWSPDGSRIAYDFDGHILVMNADGSGIVDLSLVTNPFTTTPGVIEQLPAWSPDGAMIAFVSTRPIPEDVQATGGPHLFVMNAEGTRVRRVTTGPDLLEIGRPTWGPAAP
jgi:Tol biopolymer transport system component